MAKKSTSPQALSEAFAASCPQPELRGYIAHCWLEGYKAGHRARIEESASLAAVEESALGEVPDGPWRELISSWLNYKRSRHSRYTTVAGILECYQTLLRDSCGDIGEARQTVNQSIANNYQGIIFNKRKNGSPLPHPTPVMGGVVKDELRALSRVAAAGAATLFTFDGGDGS